MRDASSLAAGGVERENLVHIARGTEDHWADKDRNQAGNHIGGPRAGIAIKRAIT